jgi:hypothetical protein
LTYPKTIEKQKINQKNGAETLKGHRLMSEIKYLNHGAETFYVRCT